MTYTCNALKRNAAAFTLGIGLAMAPLMATGALAKLVGGAEMYPTKNIVENAVSSKDHETLVKAVNAAGLVDTLSGKGPFTVFAPTDKAVAKMIKDDNGAHPIRTVSGSKIIAKMDGDNITLTDESGNTATVTIADVKQSNGVIHVIDTALLPKG
jgi:uncharacterized surface protein with fasciclin (FAS1) repeats